MKPLASAMRYGPFLAGYLKNLVLSDPRHETVAGRRTGRRRPRVRRRRRAPRRRTRRSTWRRRRRRWRIGGNDSSLSSLLHLDRPASSKPRRRRAQIFLSVIATAAPESRPEGVSGALLALTCQYNGPPRVHKPAIDHRTTRRTASKEPARDGAGGLFVASFGRSCFAISARSIMRTNRRRGHCAAASNRRPGASITNGCSYCIHSHTAAARAKGMTDAQYSDFLAVVGMASQTNALATGLQLPVDAAFLSES